MLPARQPRRDTEKPALVSGVHYIKYRCSSCHGDNGDTNIRILRVLDTVIRSGGAREKCSLIVS